MADSPNYMDIFQVIPQNYDEIIERSQDGPKPPYTKEELVRITAQAKTNNNVALIAFFKPEFWLHQPKE